MSGDNSGVRFLYPVTEIINPFQSNFFCQPHTPQLLFVLGGKEVGGITCNYPTVLKEKNIEKQKE
jgi:hypothetical protein